MNELICHLLGDFVLQNHWMANRKTSSSFAAAVHATLYTLPFLLLTRNPLALAIICGTHFLIDRFRLAKYWVAFWGVGCDGWVIRRVRQEQRNNIGGLTEYDEPIPNAPDWLAVWLLIIVDNTIHLTINHLVLLRSEETVATFYVLAVAALFGIAFLGLKPKASD